ncbi:MAG: peptide deformylase [Cyanobacteria bacterium RI_101]|jgi:peptide deformylase|nr:peptide deformylase [Cyanobacteria bacterium RI_101]
MTATLTVEKQKLDQPPLQIHYLGDKALRQPAKRVTKIDASIRALAKEMLQTMYSSNGIGLAAPQVGIHKQLLVVDCEPDKPENPPYILINPQILRASQSTCVVEEGCLSIPNIYFEVTRPEAIEVSYKDEWGRPQRRQCDGLLARVILHEIDHLNGVVFVDRVNNNLALAESLKKEGFSLQAVKPIR